MRRHLTLVETQANSALEALWREFPELQNSVMVGRIAFASRGGHSKVTRTFRLLNGQYVVIISTDEGNKREVLTEEGAEDYELVWQELGSRAINPDTGGDTAHGIRFACLEFFRRTEE